MTKLGTETNPLRVAIIGSGPTGFYTADHLFSKTDKVVKVDMFDRLPTPFGLVRYGVAPDHPKIKSVTKAYDRIASKPGYQFYGNVEFGKHLTLQDLKAHYHQVVFCTGAQTDRRMGIPGEDLGGSYPATDFVAWYNGHPDYVDYEFDLDQEQAAVVGIGNVAMDVARILCRTVDELKTTDIADYALEALSKSHIKEVYILGRRGPAQAAFTNPEIKELGEMEDAEIRTIPDEVELDELSKTDLEMSKDRNTATKVQIIQSYANRAPSGKSRCLTLRLLVSPVELYGDESGHVTGMRIVRNVLYRTEAGTLRPRHTDQFENITVGLVFRSIGYRGVPLPEVPFYDSWGVILNERGRIIDPDTHQPIPGLYTAGWIKRGPSGVIGTNKPDAAETVRLMLEDVEKSSHLEPAEPSVESAEKLVCQRQPKFFSFQDWKRIDELEVTRGAKQGRPRVKFVRVEEMLAALGR